MTNQANPNGPGQPQTNAQRHANRRRETQAACECYRLDGHTRPIKTGDNATFCFAANSHHFRAFTPRTRSCFGVQWKGPASELEHFTTFFPEGPQYSAKVHWLCRKNIVETNGRGLVEKH